MKAYDAIVAGLGGIGTAALFHLARRGLKVLGIDPYGSPNDRGSSFGETRIIRKAYFEHPDYVPLLRRSYALWEEMERRTDQELFRRTGLLEVGVPNGVVIPGVIRSALEHGLPVETIPIQEVSRRFPGFRPDDDMEAIFESDAGFLHVERCVAAHSEQARRAGAETVIGQSVRTWSVKAGQVTVETENERLQARALVLCAGPWSVGLLSSLGLPLTVRRKPVFWYGTSSRTYSLENRCPVFCFDTADGFFYGCPTLQGEELKVAEHTCGDELDNAEQLDRVVHPRDEMPVKQFVRRHLPGVVPVVKKSSVCMYTMTPDQHFLIDRHLEYPNVVFAAGFSGHGFKFAPVIGSALADLVQGGRTDEPIEFLSAERYRRGATVL